MKRPTLSDGPSIPASRRYKPPLQAASNRVAPQVALNTSNPACSTPSGSVSFLLFLNLVHRGFIEPTSSCCVQLPCPLRQAAHLDPGSAQGQSVRSLSGKPA